MFGSGGLLFAQKFCLEFMGQINFKKKILLPENK